MLNMNEIRKGQILIFEGEPYQVAAAQFSRKQQRRPVMKTTLKHVKTGKTKEHSYQQSDRVEEANIERRKVQFLFSSAETYTFMDGETYEQTELSKEMVGDTAPYLLEGQEANIVLFENKPMAVEVPVKIDRKVISAPDAVRGDTSNNVTKEIVLEGNLKVRAPMFIKEGEVVRIDTRTGDYLERA